MVLSKDGLAAIGEVAAVYSQMELFAAMSVWHSLGLERGVGSILTATLGLKQRLEWVISLGQRNGITEADIASLAAIELEFSKSAGLSQRRNGVVHAVWMTDQPDHTKPRKAFPLTFARSGKATLNANVTSEAIHQIAVDIVAQMQPLQQMLKRLGALKYLDFGPPPT
jgi:hypothetical protein